MPNELYHYGYIKRWKENGEWRYLYPSDVGGKKYTNPQGVIQTSRNGFDSKRKNTVNKELRTLATTGGIRSARRIDPNAAKQPEQTTQPGQTDYGTYYESSPDSFYKSPVANNKVNQAKKTVDRILTNQQIAQRRASAVAERYASQGAPILSKWLSYTIFKPQSARSTKK